MKAPRLLRVVLASPPCLACRFRVLMALATSRNFRRALLGMFP